MSKGNCLCNRNSTRKRNRTNRIIQPRTDTCEVLLKLVIADTRDPKIYRDSRKGAHRRVF